MERFHIIITNVKQKEEGFITRRPRRLTPEWVEWENVIGKRRMGAKSHNKDDGETPERTDVRDSSQNLSGIMFSQKLVRNSSSSPDDDDETHKPVKTT